MSLPPPGFESSGLPRQVDSAEIDTPAGVGLGKNVRGGTRPRLSHRAAAPSSADDSFTHAGWVPRAEPAKSRRGDYSDGHKYHNPIGNQGLRALVP